MNHTSSASEQKARCTFSDARDADFIACCRAVIDRYHRLGRSQRPSRIVCEALVCRAPSYYISLDHAVDRVSRMLAGKRQWRAVKGSLRRSMWSEIASRVSELYNSSSRRSLSQCIATVLRRGNASRFFITERYAMRIFNAHFKTVCSYEQISERTH